jgi:voltage-gated potassium channel
MKTLAAQVASFLRDPQASSNVGLLLKLFAFVGIVVLVYGTIFHILMDWEGQEHSIVSGFYWVLVVMSTLGFGDITFESDLGRVFSVIVLLSGITLLLVVLPFAFIQYFYAPWIDAQIRRKAPRRLPDNTRGHVLIAEFDPVGKALAYRLRGRGQPYYVIEPDPERAVALYRDDVSVVAGEPDDVEFLRAVRVDQAKLVFANREDTVNTNIALTVREVSAEVPLAAVVTRDESEDVLELSGASTVLPLKRWLGEQLANRVGTGHAEANVVGRYRDLVLAEVPVRNTPLVGRVIRDTGLRAHTGVSVVGVWERGRLLAARPDTPLTDASVAVVVGTRDQLDRLDEILFIYNYNLNPVVLIGAGRVGRAAVRALRAREMPVHVVEREPAMCDKLPPDVTAFQGDAADYDLLTAAGIQSAPAVVLTTHDDAMNIYLASYCRRLNPDLRIVSRVTHERNVEAVHRAGADFALSYVTLGVSAVLAELDDRELSVLGGELDLFTVPVPRKLAGHTLAESEIGRKTGLLVLAVQENGQVHTNPAAATRLPPSGELVLIGDEGQRRRFEEAFRA